MGLPINKSTLSDEIKAKLQNILYEDILTNNKIDQVGLMKKLVLMEKEIFNSINNKETKYYKPDNIASINSYADPLRTNGIVASMIYNELRDSEMPAINLEERNKIIKIKLDVNKKNASKIKDLYPETYEKLMRLLDHPNLGSKVNTMALPVDSEVPDWILPFVDFNTIINDNLKNFPVESIGLKRFDNDSVNFSNIISL